MKLGLMASLLNGRPYEEALDFVASEGLQAIELGTGNYPGDSFVNLQELLSDDGKLRSWKGAIDSRGLELSAFACHGNPLHPQAEVARAHHEVFRNTVLLAEKLGVRRVTLFSGCPGDQTSTYPNWVVAAWPTDFQEVAKWQWEEKVIPYWREQAEYARQHDVLLAFEMHPGMVVYNPETLLQLREACGENIGANFDPSHLYWQGVDPVLAIRALGREGCIFHVHAKDTALDPVNSPLNGVLDTKNMARVADRSWIFRSVGYGHDALHWKQIVSALRIVGYDYVLSIEHEDAVASIEEGLRKAVGVLQECILTEEPATPWWT